MLWFQVLRESVLFAWHAMVSNRLRTTLSLLGISIGIFAIISVFTAVDAIENNFRNSVASLGTNVIYIQKWPWIFEDNFPWWKYMNRPEPRVREAKELKRRSELVTAAAYIAVSSNRVMKYKSNSVENVEFMGVSEDYNKIRFFEIEEGRYFSNAEIDAGVPYAIIGADVAQGLFNFEYPIGKHITALGRKVEVIGVLKRQGESIFGSDDNSVITPVNFARNVIDIEGDNSGAYIMAMSKPGVARDEIKADLVGTMRSIRQQGPRDEDSFSLNEASIISGQLDQLFSFLAKAGWIIGGFSILVGGFGIANIMFVSVKERTNIIGIQKSLGAKNSFILLQFLVEAVVLSLFGGVVGLFMVFLGTLVVNVLLEFKMVLSLENINLALMVSGIIGVISGFTPAYSASQMDPVEAIRTN